MGARRRIAFVVSHPIQYVVPLYQRLGRRADVELKVFFTWHAGMCAVEDRGFRRPIAWDIPLTHGYEYEVVHVSGWAWLSHLQALHGLHRRGVRTLFFGDSHLLDAQPSGPRWWLKQALLRRVFSWADGFLVVGSANRAYYERFGVAPAKLDPCPHSIDVGRFAEPAASLEQDAARWRRQLGISAGQMVLLYAGKFEPKKRPAELMRAVARRREPFLVLVLVGGGELQA